MDLFIQFVSIAVGSALVIAWALGGGGKWIPWSFRKMHRRLVALRERNDAAIIADPERAAMLPWEILTVWLALPGLLAMQAGMQYLMVSSLSRFTHSFTPTIYVQSAAIVVGVFLAVTVQTAHRYRHFLRPQ